MKIIKIVLISIVAIILFLILGLSAIILGHQRNKEKINQKVELLLTEQAQKAENIFKVNQDLFQNSANEIENLLPSITEISIEKGIVHHIKKDGINYGSPVQIKSISENLAKAISRFDDASIKVSVHKYVTYDNSTNKNIYFTMFSDSDGGCLYSISIVYSPINEQKLTDKQIKLNENWYIEKSIHWRNAM